MLKSFTALEPEEQGNLLDEFILQTKPAPPIVNKLWSDMGNKESVSGMLDEGIRAGKIEDIPVELGPIDASLEIQKGAGIEPDDNKVAEFVNSFMDIAAIYMPQLRIRKIPVIGEALEKGALDFIEMIARNMNIAHDLNPKLPSAEPFIKQLKHVQKPHEEKLQQYGPIRRTVTEGIATTATSTLAGVPGALAGGWLGYATHAGLMFAGAEFDKFLEEAEAAGLKREDIMTDAVKSALIEGSMETAQNLAGARVLKLMGPIKPTAAKAVLAESLKRLGVVGVTEIGGEAATAAAQAKIRQEKGIPTPTPKEAAKQVIGPTAVMVAILAPFGIKAGNVRAQVSNARVKKETKGDWRTTTDSEPGKVGNNYIITKNKAVYEGAQSIEKLKDIYGISDDEILQADVFHKPGTKVTIKEGVPSVKGGIGILAGTKIENQGSGMGKQHFVALDGPAVGGNFSADSLKPSDVKTELSNLVARFKKAEIKPVDTRLVQMLPEKVKARDRLQSLPLDEVQAAEPSKAFAAYRRQMQAQGIPRKQIDANIRRFASEYVRSYNAVVADKINNPDDATLKSLQKDVAARDPELKKKSLRDSYTARIGDPIWNKLSHEWPLRLGLKSKFIEDINRNIITEYGQSEDWKTLRDTKMHEIVVAKEAYAEAATNLSMLTRAEQVRASQIIEGSVTVDSDKWQDATRLIDEHRKMKQRLRELGLIAEDTAFDQLSRKDINEKLTEARKLDAEIKSLQTRLRPVRDLKGAADSLATLATDRLVIAKKGKVTIPKWQAAHRRLIEDVMAKQGYKKKEAAQITSWISEGLKIHQGKSGQAAKMSDLLKRSLATTLRKRFKSLQVMQKADVKKALKKQIGAKLAKKVEQRNALIKRVQTHYKMSGKEYLRRASRLIEEEKSFLKRTAQYLKEPKRFRLIRGYNIQRKELSAEYEKKHMIKEAPFRVMKGLSHETHDAVLMELFVEISKNKKWAISAKERENNISLNKTPPSGVPAYNRWKQLPKTDKLGPLSGAFVDPFIYDDLNQAVKEYNQAIKAWDKFLRVWKAGKVVYNPATQFRNVMSNFILAWGADLAPWRMDVYSETAADYWNKGKYYKEAKTTPLFGAEWAGTEIEPFLNDMQKIKTGNALTDGVNTIRKILAAPGKTYQGIEQFFKLAVFINERKNGASITDAAKKAEKWLFNYNKIPPAIRAARRWYAPFITFSYKAMPRMAEMTVRKPWRMAAIWMTLLGVEEMSRRMIGMSEEELERERLVLPDYMRKDVLPGAMSHVLLPYTDKHGRTKWWDLSFILPWGDVAEQWGQSRLIGRAFLPNHPLYVTAAEIGFNRVFFTGQELTIKDVDEGSDYWKKIGTQVWRQFLPSLAGSYSYDKFMSAIHGERDWQGRERDLTETIFDVFLGVKIRSIDYTAAYGQRMRSLRGNVMDIRREFSRGYRKLMLNPPKDPDKMRSEYQKLFETSNEKLDRIMKKITAVQTGRQ
jgi:hypothetical protein